MDVKTWQEISLYKGVRPQDAVRMFEELSAKFRCARCGREDLPLALFNEHSKSCAFESAISVSACDAKDRLELIIDDIECDINVIKQHVKDLEKVFR